MTSPPAAGKAVEWTSHTCEACAGYGLVEAFGGGPTECFSCGGSGFYFVSPAGRIADYPGGPFRGSVPVTVCPAGRSEA